jgi:catechol 2,3-dioxygenase-like lactoylglutathione lyase family enzyme
MLGRFLEVSLATRDIAASVAFYEQLGFTQLPTNDSWSYPYCALGDGRLCIGLHQHAAPAASLCFVHPGLQAHVERLQHQGLEPREQHLGFEDFHHARFDASDAQNLCLQEARTFSPATVAAAARCGYWAAWSIPSRDFAASVAFWDRLGFIAHERVSEPFIHLPMSADHLNLALHRPEDLRWPALVFESEQMARIVSKLQALDFDTRQHLPPGLDPRENGLVSAPEGTRLLLLQGEY